MWTILWTDERGADHWSRYESREHIAADADLAPYLYDPDTMIFPPEADDLWVSGEYFEL